MISWAHATKFLGVYIDEPFHARFIQSTIELKYQKTWE